MCPNKKYPITVNSSRLSHHPTIIVQLEQNATGKNFLVLLIDDEQTKEVIRLSVQSGLVEQGVSKKPTSVQTQIVFDSPCVGCFGLGGLQFEQFVRPRKKDTGCIPDRLYCHDAV